GHYQYHIMFLCSLQYPCQAEIDGLHGDDRCVQVAGIADHVAVWIVAADEPVFAGSYSLDHLVCYFRRLHPRPFVERRHVRWYRAVRFKFIAELAAPVAVPEV